MRSLVLAPLLALLLVASCDAPKKRSSNRQVEGTTEPTVAEIKVWLASKGMQVGAVTCPPTVPVEKGYAFECHAAVDGGSQTILVEFVDDSGRLKMTLR